MNFKKICSISAQKTIDYKVITIYFLGLRFFYKKRRKKKVEWLIEKQLHLISRRLNKTIIAQCVEILKHAETNDLFCLKNRHVCYIFNNQVLKWGENYFLSFLTESFWTLQEVFLFERLSESSLLYTEHKNRMEQKEFFWKYASKDTIVTHKFLSFGEDEQVYVNDKILDDSFVLKNQNKPYFLVENSRRPFIKGTSVYEKLQTLGDDEKQKLYIDLFQYIFDTYTLPSGLLDPKLYDCHASNFILDTQGQFHLIDTEFRAPHPIEKRDSIDYFFQAQRGSVYHLSVLKHFGFNNLPKVSKGKDEAPYLKLRHKFFS